MRRGAATVLALVLGAGACSLLVRGTIDEYPGEDGDGDADSDGDGDADADGDAGRDAAPDSGVDAGCPEVADLDAGVLAMCEAFCNEEADCSDGGIASEDCPWLFDCFFGRVFVPAFSDPFVECLLEDGECASGEEGETCAMRAMQSVNTNRHSKFQRECSDRANELDCGKVAEQPSLDCELAAAIYPSLLAGWRDCLEQWNDCAEINACREQWFVIYCLTGE